MGEREKGRELGWESGKEREKRREKRRGKRSAKIRAGAFLAPSQTKKKKRVKTLVTPLKFLKGFRGIYGKRRCL
jgi:hypothetical protein